MSNNEEGAFTKACRWVIEEDMKEKTKLIEYYIEHPDEWPEGVSPMQLIFGDYQAFVNKWVKHDP